MKKIHTLHLPRKTFHELPSCADCRKTSTQTRFYLLSGRTYETFQQKSYLEPQTTSYKWLFQLDASKSLHGKWLFNQTSIKNWLFRVPGNCASCPSFFSHTSNAGTHFTKQRRFVGQKKKHISLFWQPFSAQNAQIQT